MPLDYALMCIVLSYIEKKFKAEKLYSELLESLKRTDIVPGSTEPALN
jgi:hypothetical protein